MFYLGVEKILETEMEILKTCRDKYIEVRGKLLNRNLGRRGGRMNRDEDFAELRTGGILKKGRLNKL